MSSTNVDQKDSVMNVIVNEADSITPRLISLNAGFDTILIRLRGEVARDPSCEQESDHAGGFVGNMEYIQKQISTCINTLQAQLSELQNLI